MRSKFADTYTPTDLHQHYDTRVADESHPTRAGYAETLRTVAAMACTPDGGVMADLGSGTGNLAAQLSGYSKLICVDIAENMHEVARKKLQSAKHVEYRCADLLEFFESDPSIDTILSTYIVHHLTPEEKIHLFREAFRCLKPGGRFICGDLMVADSYVRSKLLERYHREGYTDIADLMEQVHFWDVGWATSELNKIGFSANARWIAELSWVVSAEKL